MTPQPQHCEHECVCREYANNLSADYGPCCVTCQYDTRQESIRQDERDKIYKRLKNMTETESKSILSKLVTTTYVNWSDIDCLFAELKEDPEKEAAPVGDV